MRMVNVYKYHKNEGETHFSKVPDGQALFHQFGVDFEEFESGPACFSTAIIERTDGTIQTPPANMIQFADSPETKYDEDELNEAIEKGTKAWAGVDIEQL